MNTIAKVFLIGAGATGLGLLIKKASTYQAIKDKFKFFVGTPRIHNYKDGLINIAISGTKITNQSAVDLLINRLYTTVQYLDPKTNKYLDLLIQNNSVDNVQINPYSQISVPDIYLSMPVTNIGVLKSMLSGQTNSVVKVITRFQIKGTEVPAIENMVDLKSAVGSLTSLIPGAGLFSSPEAGNLVDKIKSLLGNDGYQISDNSNQSAGGVRNHLSKLC